MLVKASGGFHVHICVRGLSRSYIGSLGASWPIVAAFGTVVADAAKSLSWSLRHPADTNRWLSWI